MQEAEFDLITSCSTADIFVGKKSVEWVTYQTWKKVGRDRWGKVLVNIFYFTAYRSIHQFSRNRDLFGLLDFS